MRCYCSAQESRSHSGVNGNVQASGQGQVAASEREHRIRNVGGQHFFFQQGALGVEGTEFGLRYAVDRGTLRAPAAGEDAGAAHHAVRVDPVDPDTIPAEFGGQQPDLMGLVGLGRAVGNIVGAGEKAVLAGDLFLLVM